MTTRGLAAPLSIADSNAFTIKDNGDLVAEARVARTGIQVYGGDEMGRPDLDTVRVYRPENEVFKADSAATFDRVHVTDGHPREPVTPQTYDDSGVVGFVDPDDGVMRDGEHIKVKLVVRQADAIAGIKDGSARQLSAGYVADIDWTPGKTSDGEAYDARQTNIRINHIALVHRGRAGSAMIGDSAQTIWWTPTVTDERTVTMPNRTVMVDGLSVETTDQGAQAIEKLVGDRDKAIADKDKLVADHQAEIAKKDAEIADLKKQQVDDAAIDAMVKNRVALIDNVKRIAPDLSIEGLSTADIKRKAVVAVDGDEAVKDRDDTYVAAYFDALLNRTEGDTIRDAVRDAKPRKTDDGVGVWDTAFGRSGVAKKGA